MPHVAGGLAHSIHYFIKCVWVGRAPLFSPSDRMLVYMWVCECVLQWGGFAAAGCDHQSWCKRGSGLVLLFLGGVIPDLKPYI